MNVGNFGNRQNARQHDALDAEFLAMEADGFRRRCPGLYRQVQTQLRVLTGGIGRNPHVRDDDGIGRHRSANRDRVFPELELACRRKGVDGQKNLAAARMGIVD